MWFAIGLFTTIGCISYFLFKKIKASWSGSDANYDGIAYSYKVMRTKNGISGIKLGLDAEGKFDFSIKLEKWYDRLFKSLGLSVEFQLGEEAFDRKFYIVSDDADLLESIDNADELHAVIDSAFKLHPKYCAFVKELRCNSGRLWLEYKCEGGFSEDNIDTIAAAAVPSLRNIANHLAAEAAAGRTGFDRYAIRAAIILAISTGLAINGLGHLMVRVNWSALPFTVDTYELAIYSLLVAAAIVALLIFDTIYFLGRTSRAHLVFIEVLFIGSFGAFSTCMEELADINIEMDSKPAHQYEVTVYSKRIQHHRKSRTNYWLLADDWLHKDRRKEIDVPSSLYNNVQSGDSIVVYQRPGYLGYRWVERIEKR